LRNINQTGKWDIGCQNCEKLEKSGLPSFRNGMNDGLDIAPKTNLTGPARIDIMFDISCNLACRTCGPHSSTFWQKHLKENNEWAAPIFTPRSKHDVISVLQTLDLSNLRQVVFCGGETLLGQEYWEVANWLVDNVPDAKHQLTVCFQTNGTQAILEKNYKIVEKAHLVKLHISIDGINERFEYLRWPAKWNQVVENIQEIRAKSPSNVMFVIEETISIFNLAYLDQTNSWVNKNFSTNKEGDIVNHTRHLATGIFSIENCSQEYVDFLSTSEYANLISLNWKENKKSIENMIREIQKFDNFRNQSFPNIFPEVSDFYHRFL
jgi:pyruvate-formate lyase-activating enzyme